MLQFSKDSMQMFERKLKDEQEDRKKAGVIFVVDK